MRASIKVCLWVCFSGVGVDMGRLDLHFLSDEDALARSGQMKKNNENRIK